MLGVEENLGKKQPLSDVGLEICVNILSEEKQTVLGKAIVEGICEKDPWVVKALAIYGVAV